MSVPTAPRRYRVAFVASHVIQYQVPLYRALATHPHLDPTVLFCSAAGAAPYYDREFGRDVRWDRPLLDGYRHRFLRNLVPVSPGRPWSAVNPSLLTLFSRERFDAVVLPGYAVVSYWLAYLGALASQTPVLFRGEAVLRPRRPWLLETLKTSIVKAMLAGTCGCLSIGSRSDAFYRHYGMPEERLFFTPYTIDNEFFVTEVNRWREHRAATRAELGLPPNLPVVVFVGKLVERKRPADLLDALARLGRPTGLVYVGDGPLRGPLERRRDELGLPHVAFTGFRNQSELPRLYAAADLFALPSSHEVSPLVLNEAMCAGLGVVVSDGVPSAVDLVEAGANGAIHRCADVPGLATALELCLASGERLRTLGERSREKIAAWNHEAVAHGLLAALRACARRPRAREAG